jgi:putative ABC transport system permease protein
MFKSMLKRSWLSIARKPSRAIILGLILFAMANLVLASIAIKGAVSESTAYAKSTLGGTVYLQPDITKLRKAMSSSSSTSTPTPGQVQSFTRPEIKLSTVSSIANSSYVKDYTYGLSASAKASGFTPVTSTTISGDPGRMIRGGSEDTTATAVTGDTTIQGINSYAFISQVSDGTMTLSSGTYFDENTDNKAIISYDLANSNSLKVGDTIQLENVYTQAMVPIQIIGVYDLTQDSGFGTSSNNIYMNVKSASQFMSTTTYNGGDYSVSNVRYYLNNAENTDAFIAEANQKYPTLSSDNLSLAIDTSAYDKMVGPIESVGSFANTILWIVVIASIAIITLIVTINVKDRRYEMGVLLSLGATKANVIGQIFAELFVVGTLAFALSLGTSTLLAKSMSQGLLDSQIASSKNQSANNFGRPGSFAGGGFNRQSNSSATAISKIDVNATAVDYAILFAVGYGIVVLSLLLPAWSIVKYQPKTILSGKE